MTQMNYYIKNNLLETIKQGRIGLTLTVKSARSLEIVPLAKLHGYHGIFIDGEHSMLGLETINNLCIASLGYNIAPVVRVPGVDAGFITKALDSGAQVIVVPHIDTPEQALECVNAAKYTPIGKRSISSGFPQFHYGSVKFDTFSKVLNQDSLLFTMVETKVSVDNIDKIIDIEGVDGILIGSSDLTGDFGLPLDFANPEYLAACHKVINSCKQRNKLIGIGGIQNHPQVIKEFAKLGVNWFLGAQDLGCYSTESANQANVILKVIE